MVLTPGSKVGSFAIRSLIGVGGMGEVYRATDTNLRRDVAIKVLPGALSSDAERLARFQREARALAALNHPNIAQIHGLEQVGGIIALVMELVEGPTLADRIAEGPVAAHDAIPIARQIAEALDAAHQRGIVHRDLKPANIKLRADGVVKVLDFGLAKMADDSAEVSQISTVAATRLGAILGTAAYMSPEQARAHPVDKRTDVWAFGCVLYEMLTAHRPFDRPTATETLAALLEREPDWSALPTSTPPAVARLLRRCLEKNPGRRLRDIGDAIVELEEDDSEVPPVTRPWSRKTLVGVATAAVLVAGMTAFALRERDPSPAASRAVWLTLSAPDGYRIVSTAVPSHDGQYVAFTASSGANPPELWVRSLGEISPRRLADTSGAAIPFWSPDNRTLGFSTDGRLRTVDIVGGPVQTVCICVSGNMIGATWNAEGVILFAPTNRGALYRVPATGGKPEPVTMLDGSRQENSHRHPQFLPDGRHFLYTARSDLDTAIYVGSLASSERTRVLDVQSNGQYAAGFLLFARMGTLLAQPFDVSTLELSGAPVALAGNVEHNVLSAFASFSSDASGRTLTYRSAADSSDRLVWYDRSGGRSGSVNPGRPFSSFDLSPDGQRALVSLTDDAGNSDIYTVDMASGAAVRLTSHPSRDTFPLWSPDGASIVFASDRDGTSAIYRRNLQDETETLLVPSAAPESNRFPVDWSADGRFLTFFQNNAGLEDLWIVPLTGGDPRTLLQTPFNEAGGRLSPNGKTVAYVSNESGSDEVYVMPFEKPGIRERISLDGGTQPRWSRDGHELYYIRRDNTLMAVAFPDGNALEHARPTVLFETCLTEFPQHYQSKYAVAPDGRSLWLCAEAAEDGGVTATVALNWTARLEER